MIRIHLDTDIGGDIDDLCALAMLLRWRDVELTGITTVAEVTGKRAGYVRHVLQMESRDDIPVAAGADAAQVRYRVPQILPDEPRYWGEPIPPSPNPPEQALSLLKQSIEQGAIVAAIGPFTNLYLLEREFPGILSRARLFLMGGYVYAPREGFPFRDWQSDYNVQVDVTSAQFVLEHSAPTLVPLAVTVETALRRAYLPRLRQAGELGRLLARQAEAYAEDEQKETRYGVTCPNVPGDLINFQHDPLACAIAAGWNDGTETQVIRLRIENRNDWLVEEIDPAGKPVRVVTHIEGAKFDQFWLDTICGHGGQK